MKPEYKISLKQRLILTYAAFISLALAVLTIVINHFFGLFFSDLIRENIREKNREIVQIISEQYKPLSGAFDAMSLEALGMHFVHEGYIVTVLDRRGNPVWDARSCDMRKCMDIIGEITARMEKEIRLDGAFQHQSYPLIYRNEKTGSVSIETYAPFFYNKTEFAFLASINRLLFFAGLVFIVLSVAVSVFLAGGLSRPILKASEAARRIAREHAGGAGDGGQSIRISDRYRTRELHELSRSVNELARELEAGEQRQRRLTADVAHELRTPLACLQANVEAMIDGVWPPTAERLKGCHEEILRLGALVEDLQLLTSLEWENLSLNKSDAEVKKLLCSAAEQFFPAAKEKGITINLDIEPGVIRADYNRLKQVFINLLSNAVKYTARGSVSLKARRREQNAGPGGGWEFTVADTGVGIAAEDLPHVFERFYRSDKSRNRRTGGSGIGLAIAAAIVKAHGGTIHAESENGGSVFRVEL
jgi:signal transduction histidine kinase